MPSMAKHSPWDALRFNLRTLVVAAVPQLRASARVAGGLSAGEDMAARAMAGAGLMALLGLPVLMLSSLVLDAPLAVPAAIACGYLAISQALASSHRRRAEFISGVVLSALVGWLVLYLAHAEEPFSRTGLTAALMTPLFAAAPALARSFLSPRGGTTGSDPSLSLATARHRLSGLDRFAPSEAALIVDHEGVVVAATRAARTRFGLLPDAFEHHVTSLFDAHTAPQIMEAIGRCRAGQGPVELTVEGTGWIGEAKEVTTWTFAPCQGGAVSMHVAGSAPVDPAFAPTGTKLANDTVEDFAETPASPRGPVCDVGDAVDFALRRAGPQAAAKNISLTHEIDGDAPAACDRQIGRRIAHLMTESALGGCPAGGAIRVDARRLKGIVLLRVTSDIGIADPETDTVAADPLKLATLRTLIEATGGTLVVERKCDRQILSVRLAVAGAATTKGLTKDRVEAG